MRAFARYDETIHPMDSLIFARVETTYADTRYDYASGPEFADTVPGGTTSTTTVAIGGSVTGMIDTLGDRDWYRVSLVAGQTYTFTVGGTGSGDITDSYLRLRNSVGTLISENDDISASNLYSSITFTATTSGSYFLDVGTYNDAQIGNFRLFARADIADAVPGSTATTATLTVGGPAVNGVTDVLGDHDWYRVTLTAGQTYYFRTSPTGGGNDTDSTLTLRGPTGAEIHFNDDGGPDTYSAFRFTPTTSGVYYIDVGAYDDAEAGDYSVSAEIAPPLTVYTNDQIANHLTTGYWEGRAHHFNVAPGGMLTYNVTGLTAAGAALAREALALWTDVLGISFSEVSTPAQITFDDNQDGAAAGAVFANGITTSATVNVSTQWLVDYGTTLNSYSFQTYIHEIGHALGLGHGGNYNGTAEYDFDAIYLNDAWATTVMSYFSQAENDYFSQQGFTQQYVVSPLVADGIAVANMYGTNTGTRTGDTIYGFGNTSGRAIYDATQFPSVTYTIFDNGGTDTLNYSGFAQAQRIDLNDDSFSNIGGRVGNVSIARGAVIENAIGGSGADIIIGNAVGNRFDGNGGRDTFTGGSGADVFAYDALSDSGVGGANRDLVTDFVVSDDRFELTSVGGTRFIGSSAFSGSAGEVRAAAAGGITVVSLDSDGNGQADLEIELTGMLALTAANFTGFAVAPTAGNDVVTGTPGADFINLSQGGEDRYDGLAGNDAIYVGAALSQGDVIDGGADRDTLALQGNYANYVFGVGNMVGIETLAVMSGSDTRFGAPNQPYSYGLVLADANVAAGQTLTVNAGGLLAGENLSFNGLAETDGNFMIFGGAGIDTLAGGAGNDTVFFGNGGQFRASDSINGSSGVDAVGLQGDYGTLMEFGAFTIAGVETLALFSASDTRFGASGAVYNYNVRTHDANVAAGQVFTINANTMMTTETARIDGSAETDGSFRFFMGAGDDILIGGAGNDLFYGARGGDTMTGGGGADRFAYLTADASAPGDRDQILDFTAGDIIDLSAIDASSPTAENDDFVFIGDHVFTGAARQLRATFDGTSWLVEGDTDGDGTADIAITVTTTAGHVITGADFWP